MRTTDFMKDMTWQTTAHYNRQESAATLLRTGSLIMRYGLVAIIFWFGVFKFTATEAQAIQPLVLNSPVLSWLYLVTGMRGASRVIGCAEVLIALLILLRPVSWRASAVGSIGAIAMFLTTLSFLITTPGSWAIVDGILVPAGAGSFLIKDLFLLGAAVWSAGEALAQSSASR